MKTPKIISLLILSVFLISDSSRAEIQEKSVEYEAAGLKMKGVVYFDQSKAAPHPGILVVHEWWGLNDYAKTRARMLAELGYTAMAVDMYGGGKTAAHPDDAKKFAGQALSDFKAASARFKKALSILQSDPTVDPTKIAAIGYCFGGGLVLNMARIAADLKGVVSFHGGLTPAVSPAPGVKTKVLVCNGGADQFVTEEQITSFKEEMKSAGIDYQFINYPGAKHGFTNPDADKFAEQFKMPIGYNQEADQASWKEMQTFFDKIFN